MTDLYNNTLRLGYKLRSVSGLYTNNHPLCTENGVTEHCAVFPHVAVGGTYNYLLTLNQGCRDFSKNLGAISKFRGQVGDMMQIPFGQP